MDPTFQQLRIILIASEGLDIANLSPNQVAGINNIRNLILNFNIQCSGCQHSFVYTQFEHHWLASHDVHGFDDLFNDEVLPDDLDNPLDAINFDAAGDWGIDDLENFINGEAMAGNNGVEENIGLEENIGVEDLAGHNGIEENIGIEDLAGGNVGEEHIENDHEHVGNDVVVDNAGEEQNENVEQNENEELHAAPFYEFRCPICPLGYGTWKALRNHKAETHWDAETGVCRHCNWGGFTDYPKFAAHVKKRHPL